MHWLNWSLKLHFRLRTVSSLVPTHITHVYVQWMPYSFVWLYLFNCVSPTQFLLIKHKNIFECFSCFWKVFWFYKNCQNFQKTVLPCFGDLVAGQSNHMSLVVSTYSRFSRLTGRSLFQSQKILRKLFKISFFFWFLAT